MLHRMTFHLSGKVVAKHLDNSTAKVYLCKQGGTVFLFLSRPACCILNLAGKYGIALISAYIYTHLNVEADYLLQGWLVQKWHLLPHMVQVAFSPWDHPGGSVGTLLYQLMSALLLPENATPLGTLG